ncbi:MAG TPA: MarR family transcriptional regulator [Chloroflexota bacterium]
MVAGSESSRLGQLPGYAIGQLYRVMRHALDDALRDLDLTTPQWGTLKCLHETEGVSGAEMARMHHITPQTVNTILQNLEHAGLIYREPHPAHGTVLKVCLTDEGRKRLSDATERVESVHERMVSDLSEEEQSQLRALVSRCMRSLDTGGPKSVGAPCVDDGN